MKIESSILTSKDLVQSRLAKDCTASAEVTDIRHIITKLFASYYIHGGYQVSQKFPISKLALALFAYLLPRLRKRLVLIVRVKISKASLIPVLMQKLILLILIPKSLLMTMLVRFALHQRQKSVMALLKLKLITKKVHQLVMLLLILITLCATV